MIKLEDEEFHTYSLNIKDFASFLGVKNKNKNKNKNNHTQLQEITKRLLSRVLVIKKPGVTIQTNWLSSAEYLHGKGTINFCFDPKLKPYLLKLKERFTSYRLKSVIQLKSAFSF